MTWTVKTELVGTEPVDKNDPMGDMTELTKITATYIESHVDGTTGETIIDSQETYQLKARMGTAADKKTAWSNIWNQHKERTKVVSDPLADEGKTELEGRVP